MDYFYENYVTGRNLSEDQSRWQTLTNRAKYRLRRGPWSTAAVGFRPVHRNYAAARRGIYAAEHFVLMILLPIPAEQVDREVVTDWRPHLAELPFGAGADGTPGYGPAAYPYHEWNLAIPPRRLTPVMTRSEFNPDNPPGLAAAAEQAGTPVTRTLSARVDGELYAREDERWVDIYVRRPTKPATTVLVYRFSKGAAKAIVRTERGGYVDARKVGKDDPAVVLGQRCRYMTAGIRPDGSNRMRDETHDALNLGMLAQRASDFRLRLGNYLLSELLDAESGYPPCAEAVAPTMLGHVLDLGGLIPPDWNSLPLFLSEKLLEGVGVSDGPRLCCRARMPHSRAGFVMSVEKLESHQEVRLTNDMILNLPRDVQLYKDVADGSRQVITNTPLADFVPRHNDYRHVADVMDAAVGHQRDLYVELLRSVSETTDTIRHKIVSMREPWTCSWNSRGYLVDLRAIPTHQLKSVQGWWIDARHECTAGNGGSLLFKGFSRPEHSQWCWEVNGWHIDATPTCLTTVPTTPRVKRGAAALEQTAKEA